MRWTSVCCLGLVGCSKPLHTSGTAGTTESAGAGESTPPAITARSDPYGEEGRVRREQMVKEDIAGRGITDVRVLDAMRRVPRHRFVPEGRRQQAYADNPLPIGEGQTISQPYIVALMTEAAKPGPRDRCLEIGTGSGYQAAVLSEVCGSVYSIEYLPRVAETAKRNLRAAGYGPERVRLRTGDGYQGWPEEAPFDVILVTAAPDRVPPPLLDQLEGGGRLIVPVGAQSSVQRLERWTRLRPGSDKSSFEVEELLAVSFVPFLGDGAKRGKELQENTAKPKE